MDTIQIFCKANKRNREDKSVSVCGHIVKVNGRYEEDAYIVESEGNTILLELMALMNALLDQEAAERLNKEIVLELYVCSDYIYKILKDKEEKAAENIEETKYAEYWQEINDLINQCGGFRSYCTEKKYRQQEDEKVVKCMAHLNKIVCEKANFKPE